MEQAASHKTFGIFREWGWGWGGGRVMVVESSGPICTTSTKIPSQQPGPYCSGLA